MDEDGEGPDYDQWDGYPAERLKVLGHLREHGITDTVVLSADIHVSLAAEVLEHSYDEPVGEPVAVEIVAPSLTSQNLDDKLKLPRRSPTSQAAEAALVAKLDHVHWCEMASHGYATVDVDPARVRAEWWHMDTILEPSEVEELAAVFEVERGTTRLARRGPE
jgi:alkaline phosphatase D